MPNDKPKRPPGRPKGTTKPPELKETEHVGFYVTAADKAKLDTLGGTRWLKNKLKQARV